MQQIKQSCYVGLEQLLSKTSGKYCVGDEVKIICLSIHTLIHTCTTGYDGGFVSSPTSIQCKQVRMLDINGRGPY